MNRMCAVVDPLIVGVPRSRGDEPFRGAVVLDPRRCYAAVKWTRLRGERELSEMSRITADPSRCGGRPCLRNLRVRVKDVLDLLAAGATREEILEDYPSLEAGDITAALEYAARQSDHPVLRVA